MAKIKITFRGWYGHFIGARECDFSLNTLLEYNDIKIVVSTIGLYKSPVERKYTEIGYNRYFETMAFHAMKENEFWDANVEREVQFESAWAISEIDAEDKANDMHYKVIKEISGRLKSGEKF